VEWSGGLALTGEATKEEDDALLVPPTPTRHGWMVCGKKDGTAMPPFGERGKKKGAGPGEFETPMKGRERISRF
jgi:hypothetical protein